jgi:protein gp37
MYGQLGDGTTVDKHNPVVVTDAQGNTITGIQFVTTGYTHTVALKGDGTLLAWGHNRYGQLGDGTTVNKSNPVVVTDALGNPITGVQSIAAGGSYVVALKTDGALIAWGDNRYGQLGDGTTVDKHNPVVVTDALGNPITGIQSVATGAYHTVALKTDGTLLAWGSNWNGLLGDGTTVDKSSPVVVTDALGNTITGIQSITAGYHHTLALKTDGTLLAWGYNTVGQLGDGTTVDKYNPVVVKDAQGNPITGIQSITAGYDHTLALKTDGTLLAWGVNWYGQLGDGTTVDKHNPVVVTDALGNAVTNVATLMNNPPAPDTVPPVVTAPVDIYVSAVDVYGTPASNTLIADFLGRAAANDAVDGAIVPTNNAPATFPIGTTLVTFTATDAANNTATATANVIVQALATTAINNIANGATLAGTSQTFTWADTGASAYRLLVGSTFGGAGFFDSYALPAGTTSVTATGLPKRRASVCSPVCLDCWCVAEK